MLIRIVKLTLQIENIASFEHIFAKTHEKIRNFEGCLFLELYQDQENPGVFFTYSQWKDASYLEAYRNSNLFQETWGRTKVLFAEKPEAWSVTKKNVIKP